MANLVQSLAVTRASVCVCTLTALAERRETLCPALPHRAALHRDPPSQGSARNTSQDSTASSSCTCLSVRTGAHLSETSEVLTGCAEP